MTEPVPPPDPSNTPVDDLVGPLDPDDDVDERLNTLDLDLDLDDEPSPDAEPL